MEAVDDHIDDGGVLVAPSNFSNFGFLSTLNLRSIIYQLQQWRHMSGRARLSLFGNPLQQHVSHKSFLKVHTANVEESRVPQELQVRLCEEMFLLVTQLQNPKE
ncbi:hypothetical protein Rs2_40101 [Raphanus sativus]|nr:hypothetical protein Rs2_40101 [Raphanus sativus]